ncbi:MAG: hypothetical protein MI923_12230 [Phycisphaerales bacterium]|nr:hypothetical protein [Phycisphaerales bacterium]
MIDTAEIRAQISEFSDAYDYDASYQTALLDASPGAHAAFAAGMGMIAYRDVLPLDVHYVARITMMQMEDCGACAQLNLRMAVEAGVDREVLECLIDAPDRLPSCLQDVREHVRDVATGAQRCPDRMRRLRDRYGEAGLSELAVCLTGCRIFPTLKRAMDKTTACSKLSLEFLN